MISRRIKKITVSWPHCVVCVASFLSFCHEASFSFVTAGSPSCFQLATGEWDVTIRGNYWMDASLIFPSVDKSGTFSSSSTGIDPKIEKNAKLAPLVKRRPWGASLDCRLSLASDGTFILTPKQMAAVDDNGNTVSSIIEGVIPSHDTTEKGILDLRGSWNVLANPYCVTDRFYDQVSLTSYPRQKISKASEVEGTNIEKEERVLRTMQLTMDCRMWGRHNPRRHGHKPKQAKMTHGTFLCRDQNTPWWKGLYRPVVASFSAVRSSSKPTHEGWIDKERFGY